MVAPNSSSCDMDAICSCEMPSSSKAFDPVAAALARVFMEDFIADMDVPLCCMTASHS